MSTGLTNTAPQVQPGQAAPYRRIGESRPLTGTYHGCLERLGFATRVQKSRDPSRKVQDAIEKLLCDETARTKAADFARLIAQWDGPKLAAERLLDRYAGVR